MLDDGDTEAEKVGRFIIAKKKVDVCKLMWDELLWSQAACFPDSKSKHGRLWP